MAVFTIPQGPPDPFPEGCIIRLDGTVLQCYAPSGLVCPPQDDSMCRDIFLRNAFFFFHNAGRILADSRMFLTPVPVTGSLAYIGSSAMSRPTLGTYLEWWESCPRDVTHDLKGREALTYHIAGSPLTGRNHCSCVYPDGRTRVISFPSPFSDIYQTFITINRRYTEASRRYAHYSLQQVIDKLLTTGAVPNPVPPVNHSFLSRLKRIMGFLC